MGDLLRSLWSEPRPANPPPRSWRDRVLVAVVIALAVVEALVRHDLPGRWLTLAIVIGLAPTVLWRRAG